MIFFFVSLFIVAFGQPLWLGGILAPIAAVCGYALFWKRFQGKFWIASGWFMAVQMIQLSWMTSIEFQGVYILFCYVGICFWLGVQFGLLTFFVQKTMTLSRMLALASLWTIMEWGRTQVLCGFSFNPAGLALTSFLPSMQGAALFGIWGLSFYVIFTNLACMQKHYKMALCLAIFPYLAGELYLQGSRHEEGMPLKIALIQTGLLPSQKIPLQGRIGAFISPYEQWQSILHYLQLQEDKQWDLIVLPESVVPFSAEHQAYHLDVVKNILIQEGIEIPKIKIEDHVSNLFWMQALSSHFKAHVIAGLDAEDQEANYATAYHVSPQTKQIDRYEKRILVPLAEYLPFSFLKPLVASYGIKNFFTHGSEAKIFDAPIPLSVSICYEETFPQLVREGRLKGANLFVNVTNDNWYPNSILPKQHFDLGRVRAVENGVPVVRACNSGMTAAIDCYGRITALFKEKAGVLSVTLDAHNHLTPYFLWGDWGILGICLLFLTLFLRNHLAQKAISRLTSYQLDQTF